MAAKSTQSSEYEGKAKVSEEASVPFMISRHSLSGFTLEEKVDRTTTILREDELEDGTVLTHYVLREVTTKKSGDSDSKCMYCYKSSTGQTICHEIECPDTIILKTD